MIERGLGSKATRASSASEDRDNKLSKGRSRAWPLLLSVSRFERMRYRICESRPHALPALDKADNKTTVGHKHHVLRAAHSNKTDDSMTGINADLKTALALGAGFQHKPHRARTTARARGQRAAARGLARLVPWWQSQCECRCAARDLACSRRVMFAEVGNNVADLGPI